MKIITKLLADIFKVIYNYTGSFGWSIVIFTVLVKLILYPFTAKQNKFIEQMKEIQPQMQAIQEKYKDRPEEMNRKIFELYQKHKINPLTGCLPMILQIPILFAIFALLKTPEKYLDISFGIKEAFFYGINLMAPEKFIFPILAGVTTYWQQKLMSTADNPQQSMMLYFFPFLIAMFTANFPAGLAFYWILTNILTIAQLYLSRISHTLHKRR